MGRTGARRSSGEREVVHAAYGLDRVVKAVTEHSHTLAVPGRAAATTRQVSASTMTRARAAVPWTGRGPTTGAADA
ncbi:hypothetical protein GCM10009566_72220 [Streptomyces murinus]